MTRMEKLLGLLEARYREKTKRSLKLYQEAQKVLVRGGSHSIRLWSPYPFMINKAKGAFIFDVDRNSYIDYWQGHYANILGHNPEIVHRELKKLNQENGPLHTGFESEDQIKLANLLLGQLGYRNHKVRFTTSGTLAAMYSVMLAKAYTGREYILKVGGGWHGASPYLLKGVKYYRKGGFSLPESEGIFKEILEKILITRFNDGDDLRQLLKRRGKEIACFIIEPFLGVGGFLAASQEYLTLSRELTEKYGIVLIFDEVISGFRFCPSGVQKLYAIQPDLSTFGKLIGGGHAVAAVVGRDKIIKECERKSSSRQRVLFEGGTFSAHAEYMRAGYIILKYLVDHASHVYPSLARAGEKLRRGIEDVFRAQGIEAKCTGYGREVIPGSSLFMVNFPLPKVSYLHPEELLDEKLSRLQLREEALKLALLLERVHVVHGGGAVSLAHDDQTIEKTIAAYGEAANLFKKYLY